jgi:Gluconate 2-dehydrogenase subunit 3
VKPPVARPPGGRRPGHETEPTVPPGGPRRFPGFDVLAELPRWDLATAAAVNARLGPQPALRFFTPAEEATATALLDLLLGQSSPEETPHACPPSGPAGSGAADGGDEGQDGGDGGAASSQGGPYPAPRQAAGPGPRQQPEPGRDGRLGEGSEEDGRVPLTAMIDARLAEAQTDGWRYADMPEDGQAWRDTLAGLDADAQAKHGTPFARCDPADQAALIQAVQDTGSGTWHGLPAARVWSLWTRYACTAFYAHPWAWNEIGFPGPAYPRGYKNLGTGKREPFEVADTQPAHDPVREDA